MFEFYDVSKNIACFLCDHLFKSDEESWFMFNEYSIKETPLKLTLAEILASVLNYEITENSVHSILLCNRCKTLALEYKNTELRVAKLRASIFSAYERTAEISRQSSLSGETETDSSSTDSSTTDSSTTDSSTTANDTESDIVMFPKDTEMLPQQEFIKISPLKICNEPLVPLVQAAPNKVSLEKVELRLDISDDSAMKIETGDIKIGAEEILSRDIKPQLTKPQKVFKNSSTQTLNDENLILPNSSKSKSKTEKKKISKPLKENVCKSRKYHYKCDVCEQKFLREKSFMKHEIQHRKENVYETFDCAVCQKKFFKKRNLTRHQEKHAT